MLERMSSSPMVTLNRIIAVGMVHGPAQGLELLHRLETDSRIAGHYRLAAVRAHLLERAGDLERAIAQYTLAAGKTLNIAERDYLTMKAVRVASAVRS